MTARLQVAPGALAAGEVEVTGDAHHYLFRVRRMTIGDRLDLFDGAGARADGEVVSVAATRATVRVGVVAVEPARCRITVIQALIKGDRMDVCLQKLVEVGVDDIVLFEAARAVVKLDDERARKRHARYQAIVADAARQAERASVPGISPPRPLTAALAALAGAEVRLACHPAAHDRPLRAALPARATSAVVIVGPEGGLAPAELEQAAAAGYEPASLGPTVLRAETAGPVAVALLRFALDG